MTTPTLIGYLLLVMAIGVLSRRSAKDSSEDYFVASRRIGPFVLLMSLFGTHMTAFALLGASAESYRSGIGVFTLMASSSALVVPAVFFYLGRRVWSLGKEFGFLTQVQFVRARWQSDVLGTVLFSVLVLLLVPYLLIGVMGAGITLGLISDGWFPTWFGSLLIVGVVMFYVSYGGLRATAWVNTFQTCVFLVLSGLAAVVVLSKLGGLETAMARVGVENPELLVRGDRIAPVRVLTYAFIPLSVGMFPHIFMHWLSAQNQKSFRASVVFYPLCITAVWLPMVVLGVLGHLDFPGLAGPQASSILVREITLYAPGVLAGLLGAGVVAAIMSSLDSQSLSLSTMFTEDIVRHYGTSTMSSARGVLLGRTFVVAVLTVVFLLSLVTERTIFGLAVWSFTGFAALVPILVAGLYWRRSTAAGVFASIATVVSLWLFFFMQGWGKADASIAQSGVMPVAVLVVASSLVLIVVSWLSKPPPLEVVDRYVG